MLAKNKKTILPMHIRWMIARDMPEVLEIERLSFDVPWDREDFLRCLAMRNCIGMTCELATDPFTVVGFMLYELKKKSFDLLNFAVHPDFRRRWAGSLMVDKLVSKLSSHRRSKIVADVSERNFAAQLFFRANGFQAVNVLRNRFDNGDDAYRMVYFFSERGFCADLEE